MKFPFQRIPLTELKSQYGRRGIKLSGDGWNFHQGLLWLWSKDLKLAAKQWVKISMPEFTLDNAAIALTYINHPKIDVRVQHIVLVGDKPEKFNISFEIKASEDLILTEPLVGVLPL